MRRLFVPRAEADRGRVTLGAADLHYVRDVLRLAPGAAIEIFDGEGGTYAGRVAEEGDAVVLSARREGPRPAVRIHLAFALARGERCDLVLQKSTELGVTRLSAFEAARSVVRLAGDRAEERARRWGRIVAEAARQCGRADVPTVDVPASLERVLGSVSSGDRIVVPYERGGEPLADAVDPAAPGHVLVVGPEGGFTPEEIERCVAAGARLVTLGPRILRFETAAIVTTALVQHLVGDLGLPPGTAGARARDAAP